MRPIRRALLSVSDKTGLVEFGRGLAGLGTALVSTGGTAKALREAGLAVADVAAVTGFPEMLDGRVKTLHPRIHAGLLARRDDPNHLRQAEAHGIDLLDLVAVNLYPFEATVRRPGASLAEAIEQIDIGGPALIRSAAKNHAAVAVLVDPADYGPVLEALREGGGALGGALRLDLARKAFAHTARYDSLIAGYLAGAAQDGRPPLPDVLTLAFTKVQDLRYGENPHQRAAFYRDADPPGPVVASARQLHGKELSFNNLLDLHAALLLAQEFEAPAAVIIKHNTPCGVATAARQADAYRRARETDPTSAFGGVLGFNRPVDPETAGEVAATFVEAVIAPGFIPGALPRLTAKAGLRLLEVPAWTGRRPPTGLDLKRVGGGLLVQDPDADDLDPAALRVATRRAPTEAEGRALGFAWRVAKHVKSNAIVLATESATVGIGAGQMSRVDSVRLAVDKARGPTAGAVMASDAFFPFRDGIDAAAAAGITAVIQPGGSVRDAEVIAAADEHGLAMLFTGIRHFRH
jgi:phosphoribosylaminoimidazolecarboxamide formyltransferase/IMP cyclohydrolase